MLIHYDPSGVFLERGGIARDALAALSPRLKAARDEVMEDAKLWARGGDVPKEKQPVDAGFFELPERLLAEHERDGEKSELARLRASADRLAKVVDSVAVLGIGGSYMGARTMLEACCHQYFNEVAPAMRRGRPRIYFEGNNVDNDALLDLVRLLESRGDRWGVAVISKSGGTLETAVAFRLFYQALLESCGGSAAEAARLVIPVTGSSGRLCELAQALGCTDVFPIPEGVGGRFSVLSAVGLLPAALLGLDVVELLRGAAAMNDHFRRQDVGANAVLDYVGVAHLMEQNRGATIRVLSTWGQGLEAAGLWYDQLLSESLGKSERGATPITVVNTRDLHSRGQQHQEGRRDKLITNLIVDQVRRDRLSVGRAAHDQDQLNLLADKTLPEILAAALAGTNQAYAEDRRPTADLHLPRLDEASLGQLLQLFMLATVVEGRLIGVNPYGQPGVEGYKKHMNALLRG
jgi:glucose-6-phosphate isomerase